MVPMHPLEPASPPCPNCQSAVTGRVPFTTPPPSAVYECDECGHIWKEQFPAAEGPAKTGPAGEGAVIPFEGLVVFAITHELCASHLPVATRRDGGTIGFTVRCPGCGSMHGEALDLDDIRAHVLGLARRGGFIGTFEELSEAEYIRILSSPLMIDAFIALSGRLRKFERLH
jgi:hypothetical protein